ncbi:MAG TPA: nitroreductase/quinone reductase family protein [Anaerolineales bacterium]|nr:nitroreductase/quinone reductase family protein [Anaerolineales bacterium]
MWYNSIMSAVLRSPLHGMLSKNMMLITVTGKKSGREYTTPVSHTRQGDDLWVISKRERTWWRNLIGGAPVRLELKGEPMQAYGEAIVDEAQVTAQLGEYISRFPSMARGLGVVINNGEPDRQTLEKAAQTWLFVCLRLS